MKNSHHACELRDILAPPPPQHNLTPLQEADEPATSSDNVTMFLDTGVFTQIYVYITYINECMYVCVYRLTDT